jgi:hypothetical protein
VYWMQRAQARLRIDYTTNLKFAFNEDPSMPWETSAPLEKESLDRDYDLITLPLIGTVRLTDQSGIREAARSASYLVFRQLLLRRIKVSFCPRCGGVFELGKRTKYCCVYCARSATSEKAKFNVRARMNRARIMAAIEIIEHLLEYPRSNNRKDRWRDKLEQELRRRSLIEANAQASQVVGQWINAAHALDKSRELKKLVGLLTHSRTSTREGAKFAKMVSKLLSLVVQVNARAT